MKITTIKLTQKTKKRLDKLKNHPRSTYEETLQRILEILNICRIDPQKARLMLIKADRKNTHSMGQ